jgi:hypothetical protein
MKTTTEQLYRHPCVNFIQTKSHIKILKNLTVLLKIARPLRRYTK